MCRMIYGFREVQVKIMLTLISLYLFWTFTVAFFLLLHFCCCCFCILFLYCYNSFLSFSYMVSISSSCLCILQWTQFSNMSANNPSNIFLLHLVVWCYFLNHILIVVVQSFLASLMCVPCLVFCSHAPIASNAFMHLESWASDNFHSSHKLWLLNCLLIKAKQTETNSLWKGIQPTLRVSDQLPLYKLNKIHQVNLSHSIEQLKLK